MRSPVLDASTSTAARGRTISDLINQCSRRTPAGTTSQQRSTLPAAGRGTICLQGSRMVPGEGQCSPAGGYRTRVCRMAGSLTLIREGPLMVEGKLLLGHAQQVRWGPGTAGESFAGQHGCGSRLSGQAVPGE